MFHSIFTKVNTNQLCWIFLTSYPAMDFGPLLKLYGVFLHNKYYVKLKCK